MLARELSALRGNQSTIPTLKNRKRRPRRKRGPPENSEAAPPAEFSRFRVHHRDLLIARVKIASYNHHRSAPFPRALVV
jgi:hypothetical protein